ncbi:MAG: DbpA RNA binding domain-containing protein, partial [Actinomycetota bacterium]
KIEPRQIVGAIANEGGLRRQDFGAITIRPDFSLVELPAELSAETWDALRSTRISGKLIGLKKDDGAPGGRAPRSAGPPSRDRKPRHKSR